LTEVRKYIIENEKNFSNDYRSLLKQLFEAIYDKDISQEIKTEMLLVVSKGMELDAFVIDKEINAFTVIINLSKLI